MHKFHTLSGLRTRYHGLRAFASPAVVAVLVAAVPHLALAAEHKLCVRWRVDAIDRTAGTLDETTFNVWPARGVRLRVSHTDGTFIAEGRTNTTDGCFSYQDVGVPGQTTYRSARVYYDTRVGTPSDGETVGRVQVRGFFTQTEETNNTDVSIQYQYVGFISFPDNTYRGDLVVGTGVAPMSISMASVSHTLHRLDTAITDNDNKPDAPPVLKVILRKCQYVSNWSCLEASTGRLFLISDQENAANGSTKRKFVSGHEAGHWLDYHWGGQEFTFASSGTTASSYTYAGNQQASLAQPCRFTWMSNGGQGNSAHAMRSQEYQQGAVREAFAHFMALYAYNVPSATLDPVFQYYKTETASNVDGSYPANDLYFGAYETTYPGSIAVPSAYLQSPMGCNCTALGNCQGTSTQMQWMRAYWWYLLRDEPGGLKPTLSALFGQLQSADKFGTGIACGPNVNRCYGAVTAAVPAGFLARWQYVGTKMGLASDTP